MIKKQSVYDKNGNVILKLVQYDKDVKIYIKDKTVTGYAPVHFYNCGMSEALVVDSGVYENGILSVKIPNILLLEDKQITGFVYILNDGGEQSLLRFDIDVIKRAKPGDWIEPESDDYISIVKLKQDVLDALAQAVEDSVGRIGEIVDQYLEEHPVSVPVQSVNNKTGNVQLTASDVGALPDDTKIPPDLTEELGIVQDELRNKQPSGDYALRNELPTKISELENDSGYLTEHQSLAEYVKDSELASVAKSGNYTDLANRPTIPPDLTEELEQVQQELEGKQPSGDYALKSELPTKVSQLENDSEFASTDYVDGAVSANTAYYISKDGSPFASLSELQSYSGTLTNNDYAFVVGNDAQGNVVYTRYKYNASTSSWAKEYDLNNSSFTADQWAAITSGITADIVQGTQQSIQQIETMLGGKQDAEVGKGLSTNDYSDEEKAKVQHLFDYATEKRLLAYDGTKIIDEEMNILSFKDIYDILLESPDFVVIVYGNRVYHPAYIEYVEGGASQLYFNATMIDGGHTKTNRIYIRSADGIEIAGISTTPVVNENVSNKVTAITAGNKTRTDLYPSVAAAVGFAEAEAGKRYTLPDGGIPVDDLSSAVKGGLTAPVAKTDEMNQPVGKDADGKLWTKPSAAIVEVDDTLEISGAPADAKTVGDKLDEKVDVKSTVVYYDESAEDDEEYDEYVLYDEFSGEVNQLKEDLAGKLDDYRYELIEEITFTEDVQYFVRTMTPNGEPYNFSKILISARLGSNFNLCRPVISLAYPPSFDYNYIATNILGANDSNQFNLFVGKNHGMWVMRAEIANSNGVSRRTNYLVNVPPTSMQDRNTITGIRLNDVSKAGSTFYIYGVK